MEMDSRLKWDLRFLALAEHIASWSKDPSTKVGAVLVRDRIVVATGYNGFPPGIADDARLNDRDEKYALVVHAEMNAILQAGHRARGATMYLAGFCSPPCGNCAKHVIAAGVARYVHWEGEVPDRWIKEVNQSRFTLEEAGVEVMRIIPTHPVQDSPKVDVRPRCSQCNSVLDMNQLACPKGCDLLT